MTLFTFKIKNRFRDEEVPTVKTLHDYQIRDSHNLSFFFKIRRAFRNLILKIS